MTTSATGTSYTETDSIQPMRRRSRRRVYASPVASARPKQPIVLDLRHLLWQLRAACNGMDREMFFRPDQDVAPLRAVCASCPVQRDCLDYANEHRLLGFWGGATEDERARQRRRARRAQANA
jgi:WhiB family redox-sensing transcriptional regulator